MVPRGLSRGPHPAHRRTVRAAGPDAGGGRLEHLALIDVPVDVSLDLFTEWSVLAADELSLAGTALRADVDNDRTAFAWRREAADDAAPHRDRRHGTPPALSPWRRTGGADAAPTVTIAPHDVRTFRLEVEPVQM